jgi:hypothetical protein
MKYLRKFRLLLVLTVIIIWSLATESIFQKTGVSSRMHIAIVAFTFCLTLFYTIPSKYYIWLERIILSFILTIISLTITTSFLMDRILSIILGSDYEIKLWEFLPTFITNLIYYSLSIFPSLGILRLLEEYKKLPPINRTSCGLQDPA